MAAVALAEAKARLSELVDRAQAGETITITRRGKPAVILSVAPTAKAAFDWQALRNSMKDAPWQDQGAGEFIRAMRDADRY
jgi:prevent-host-death family protein